MNQEEYEYVCEEILNNEDICSSAQEVGLNEVTKYYQEHKGYSEGFLPQVKR